jgi:hypothetical protein
MPDLPLRLAERLELEGQKSAAFFRSLTSSQFNLSVYADGSCWSSRQILAHFVSAEQAFTDLIFDVLRGGSGAPLDFNIDEFNEREVKDLDLDPPVLVDNFVALRKESTALVAGMQPADLARTGRHPFLGEATLEEIIKLLYRHNQIHQRDIRRTLFPISSESVE